ncbi:MAG TPA: hypothetical protein VG713_00625 [Pirellulales bacterium]|nr:hypothetical protein [Pirellulales bacterium]
MSASMIDRIADAVLYEGYLLYPYRASVKNRQRWTLGGVLPQAWCATHATGDLSSVQTECLIVGDCAAEISLQLRFLHIIERQVYAADAQDGLVPVDQLSVDSTTWQSWQEATERGVTVEPIALGELLASPRSHWFSFVGSRTSVPLMGADGVAVGAVERTLGALHGTIDLRAEPIDSTTCKVTVRVTNTTACDDGPATDRERALASALASAHLVLSVSARAEFVSLIDPPEQLRAAAAGCRNQGLWPVLVGEAADRSTMLAAPIFLYDYPQIAPESPGDLFDGTEIDEILSLRIRTLADEERAAIRGIDPRARELLERTESLDPAELGALHGALRPVQPSTK